jgi:hypothetical protein
LNLMVSLSTKIVSLEKTDVQVQRFQHSQLVDFAITPPGN